MSGASEPTDASTARIVFVCGNSRSGTTMTSRILGRAQRVFTFEELHFFEGTVAMDGLDQPLEGGTAIDLAARLLAVQSGGFRHPDPLERHRPEAERVVAALDEAPQPADVYAAVVHHVAAAHGADIACDQTPRNVYLLDDLLSRFPHAQAVIVVRDPRDVLLSQKHRHKRAQRGIADMARRDQLRLWAGYHPFTTAQLWRSGYLAGAAVASHPRVHVLSFESLVTDPNETVEALCSAVGVDFSPSLLDVPTSGSSHGSTVGRGIDPGAAGRWRSGAVSDAEVAIAERVVGSALTDAGYEPSDARIGFVGALFWGVQFPVRVVLALALNAGRMRGLVAALRRRLTR